MKKDPFDVIDNAALVTFFIVAVILLPAFIIGLTK
mgnify:CR=1 FL=1|jgi:hypothetical protein|tara:strand:+ start:807 stop:911 length:105 start_codon:yes stop_codon:yes gene_type:complete